jgi:hypothetical protein
MKDEHMLLVLDYLEGRLSPEEENKLKAMIHEGIISREEITQMQDFYLRTEVYEAPEPSERLRQQFYADLEKEHAKVERKSWWRKWLPSLQLDIKLSQLAYSFVIFLLGLLIGLLANTNQGYEQQMADMRSELQNMQESLVVNLLEQPSATQRLKAVSISTGLQQANDKITGSLLHTLNNDPDVNVRMAALDALLNYAEEPLVREGLIRSIAGQDAPMMQLAMAEAMVALREKRSVDELQKLLKKDDINEMVAQEIRKSISALS